MRSKKVYLIYAVCFQWKGKIVSRPFLLIFAFRSLAKMLTLVKKCKNLAKKLRKLFIGDYHIFIGDSKLLIWDPVLSNQIWESPMKIWWSTKKCLGLRWDDDFFPNSIYKNLLLLVGDWRFSIDLASGRERDLNIFSLILQIYFILTGHANNPFLEEDLLSRLFDAYILNQWLYQIGPKELSFCHKLTFSKHYFFATWWCKPLIFQT